MPPETSLYRRRANGPGGRPPRRGEPRTRSAAHPHAASRPLPDGSPTSTLDGRRVIARRAKRARPTTTMTSRRLRSRSRRRTRSAPSARPSAREGDAAPVGADGTPPRSPPRRGGARARATGLRPDRGREALDASARRSTSARRAGGSGSSSTTCGSRRETSWSSSSPPGSGSARARSRRGARGDRVRAERPLRRGHALGRAGVGVSGGAQSLDVIELHPPPLVAAVEVRRDQHPAWVYLASLAEGSRPAMRSALEAVAALLTDGALDAERLPWAALRYPHLMALRARLADRYAPKRRARSSARGVAPRPTRHRHAAPRVRCRWCPREPTPRRPRCRDARAPAALRGVVSDARATS